MSIDQLFTVFVRPEVSVSVEQDAKIQVGLLTNSTKVSSLSPTNIWARLHAVLDGINIASALNPTEKLSCASTSCVTYIQSANILNLLYCFTLQTNAQLDSINAIRI